MAYDGDILRLLSKFYFGVLLALQHRVVVVRLCKHVAGFAIDDIVTICRYYFIFALT